MFVFICRRKPTKRRLYINEKSKLCFLPLIHFLYSCRMNGENSHQSLVSKECLLDFALRANLGNGPLSIVLFFRSSKRPHKVFCPFSTKHGLFDRGRHFWSSWDWEWLLTPMAQIQDGGNENTPDRNIFRVYTPTSHDILILMFCTSSGQCKVNVGCICWTAARRKLLIIFFKFSFQDFRSHDDSLYNQLYWTEVESFKNNSVK